MISHSSITFFVKIVKFLYYTCPLGGLSVDEANDKLEEVN